MIWIDYTLVGLVFICVVVGLLRGLVKEFISLLFWLLAAWVSLTFSRDFSVLLASVIDQPTLRMAAAFLSLLVITLILGALIGFLLGVLTKNDGLRFADRFGGMVLGVARSIIVVTVVIMLAGFTSMPKDSWWAKSSVIPPFQIIAIWLRDHLSSGIAEHIRYNEFLS